MTVDFSQVARRDEELELDLHRYGAEAALAEDGVVAPQAVPSCRPLRRAALPPDIP
jgi:hypothetical protein